MGNPATHLTAFHFYCNSFEELPAKMEQEVGYKVLPKDVWSINIQQHELNRLMVTLTIIYWKEK
jgi:hypothetical protein